MGIIDAEHLSGCSVGDCACHRGVARRLALLMYSHVHCGCSPPPPCDGGACDIFWTDSQSLRFTDFVDRRYAHNPTHATPCRNKKNDAKLEERLVEVSA